MKRRRFSLAAVGFVALVALPLPGSGPVRAAGEINTATQSSTPAVISAADEIGLRAAKTIADKLTKANAAGLKSVTADEDFKKAVADFNAYIKASGSAGLQAMKLTGDPRIAIVAAIIAGEYTDKKGLIEDLARRPVGKGSEFAADKIASRLLERDGLMPKHVPTLAKDAAKVGARFIMAYENGFIDSVAPDGLRPLLKRNETTAKWLQDIDARIAAERAQQSPKSGGARPSPAPVQDTGRQTTPGLSPGRPASIPGPTAGSTPQAILPGRAPGGISLSRAAAERMPLNIDIDSSYLDGGKIVLSGRNSSQGIDAALFLTTVRLACEPQDPYFSLDPDGPSWAQDGEAAFEALWSRIKDGFAPDVKSDRGEKPGSTINLKTVSATRDYPSIWPEIAGLYPNFRSKLVFSPEWMRDTRFGEILYKADVLLKELASGSPILSKGRLRALSVDGYLAADAERAAKSLLFGAGEAKDSPQEWRGSRLWFDISPSPSSGLAVAAPAAAAPVTNQELESLLRAKGLIRTQDTSFVKTANIAKDGDALDLSRVNPRMFVRVHDHATGQDLSVNNPDLDGLANDVSNRFDRYAEKYQELRLLREIFRSYIVAVQLVRKNMDLCNRLSMLPLYEAEKVAGRLPGYHPSEIFVTVVNHRTITSTSRRAATTMASSINGGVSIAGRRFFDTAIETGTTPITDLVKRAAIDNHALANDRAGTGRAYALLVLDGELDVAPDDSAPENDGKIALTKPLTGTIRNTARREALAPLSIETETGSDYLFKLVNVSDENDHIMIYLRGGETYSTKMPLGSYKIRVASGQSWYGRNHLFGPNTKLFRLRNKVGETETPSFEFRRTGNSVEGMRLSLKHVVSGNMDQETISRSDF